MLFRNPEEEETTYADFLSDLIIPLFIVVILMAGLMSRRNVYADFVKGAKNGLKTVVDILPTLAGLMVAVGILRASGLLDAITGILGNAMDHVGFPSQLVPLAVVRMFSSSAATGLLLDIYEQFGTDSRIGRIASVMMSSSETIFLYNEYLFYDYKSKKDTLDIGRGVDSNYGRDCSKRVAGWVNSLRDSMKSDMAQIVLKSFISVEKTPTSASGE